MINSQQRSAIFVPSMRGGGAERAMLRLAGGIAGRGYAVDLVLAQAVGPYLAQIPPSVRLVDLKASRILLSLPALVRYLRREQPQVMLSSWDYANIIALWARRLTGVPRRVVVNDQKSISHMARHASNWRGRLTPRLMRFFYPWADGVTVVSKGVADDLAAIAGIPRERIQVIYNPVVTPEVRVKAQAPLDHPWFEPGQPPVVLAIGRLVVQKDFPTLLRAFAEVRKHQSARLLILGEGPDRPMLEALIRQLRLEQAASLSGFAANPYAYLARASLFVLSSGWEGLPTVLIEALYCGTPIVSTDCPSGPREILADGQYGQLVPVGDVPALARAIETTLTGTTSPQPEDAWRPYDLETVVDQYVNVLLER